MAVGRPHGLRVWAKEHGVSAVVALEMHRYGILESISDSTGYTMYRLIDGLSIEEAQAAYKSMRVIEPDLGLSSTEYLRGHR